LKAAVDKQDWDQSVKSLVAVPDVLAMMSGKLDWTQKLGDAVVAQNADVMDAIQRLRAKAQANNKLASTPQQTVTVRQADKKQVIGIEPTEPDTIYVPYYDPAVVYGDWPYSDYPPYAFAPPSYVGAGILATGVAFGTGYALSRWRTGGNRWGGSFNWNNNNINVNRSVSGGGTSWNRVERRQGAGDRGGRQQGVDFRGSGGQQVLKPGDRRGDIGNRTGGGDRTGAGNRTGGGNRTGAGGGNRGPSGGTRPSGKPQPKHSAAKSGRTGQGERGGAKATNRGGASRTGGGARTPGGGGGARTAGGGGGRTSGGARGGGGGARTAGGRGGGGRGGGRRSDIRLKHDITLLGHLGNGLGFYRFRYNGSNKAYVGVMAQEVQQVVPEAVARGRDGYLRVNYTKLGVKFDTYERWLAAARPYRSRTDTQSGKTVMSGTM
jgi:hypothetical protein